MKDIEDINDKLGALAVYRGQHVETMLERAVTELGKSHAGVLPAEWQGLLAIENHFVYISAWIDALEWLKESD